MKTLMSVLLRLNGTLAIQRVLFFKCSYSDQNEDDTELESEETIFICHTKRRTPQFKKAKRLSGISSAIVFIFSFSSSLLCFTLLCSELFFHHQQQPFSGAEPLQRITYNPRDDSPGEGRGEGWHRALCGGTELNPLHTVQRGAGSDY